MAMKLEDITDLAGTKYPERASVRVTADVAEKIRNLKKVHKKDPSDFMRKAIERALEDVYGNAG